MDDIKFTVVDDRGQPALAGMWLALLGDGQVLATATVGTDGVITFPGVTQPPATVALRVASPPPAAG